MAKTRRKRVAGGKRTTAEKNGKKIPVTDEKVKDQFNRLMEQITAAKVALADAEVSRMTAYARVTQLEAQRHQLAEQTGKDLIQADDLAGWTFMVDTLEFVHNPAS